MRLLTERVNCKRFSLVGVSPKVKINNYKYCPISNYIPAIVAICMAYNINIVYTPLIVNVPLCNYTIFLHIPLYCK